MKLTLETVMKGIEPVSQKWCKRASEHLKKLAIPQGSLGVLLKLSEQLAAIQETLKPSVENKVIVTMAGDHGVVEEGISAFLQEVTPQMVANFVAKGAGINVLAEVAGAEVIVVDMGVAVDMNDLVEKKAIFSYKVDYGTKNMTKGPAMTREQAIEALEAGIDIAKILIQEKGVQLLGTGDMGIGNTTPSSAIAALLTGKPVSEVTGRGTGIGDKDFENKIKVIEKALEVNKPDKDDALDVLTKVGGYEIAGIAGLILGASYYKTPIVVDGFISTAGALIAKGLAPFSVDYMIASHNSVEGGHKIMWEELGLRPLLDLDFRLGEGTGAAVAMNLVESAAQIINKMLTFEDAGVTENV